MGKEDTDVEDTGVADSGSVAATISDDGADIDVAAAMTFDPFDTENLNGADEPTPDGGTEDGSKLGKEGEASAEGKKEGEEGTPLETSASPELDLANEKIKALTETVEAMKSVATQPPAPVGTPEGADPAQTGPAFNFDIPDALLEKFNSEDSGDRKQALSHMAQGVAQAAHAEAVKYVNDVMSQVLPQFVNEQINMHTQQKVIFDDFYGQYPQYNMPELRQTVVGVAQAVLKESGLTEWSPALRDAVATRLSTLFPTAGAQKPAAGATPATPKTPYMGGDGARPGTDLTPEATELRDIRNTLF